MLRDFVKSALEQYLNDNGAASICKTHIDPMTDKVLEAIEASNNEPEPAPEDGAEEKKFGANATKQEGPEMRDGRIVYKGNTQQSSGKKTKPVSEVVNPRNPRHRTSGR